MGDAIPSPHTGCSSRPRWKPTVLPTQPAKDESIKDDIYEKEMAAAEKWGGGLDFSGRAPKRLKPRRTVDYMSGMARWHTLRKLRHGLREPPPIYPSPSNMVNLLPALAYKQNPMHNICDVFIHSSMNKERSQISVAKFSPDGRWCLTGNQMGQFTIWNNATFNFESLKQAHDHPIRSLSYSHSGLFFLSGDQGGILKYYTPTINNLESVLAHREAVRAISFSPGDEKFVTGGDDGAVKVWGFGGRVEERVLNGHGWDVRCVDWHPHQGLIASGSKDMLVKFWDPRSGKDLSTLRNHKAVINALEWSKNGHMLATAGGDGTVRLFDIRAFKELEALRGHPKEVTSVTWHPIHPSILSSGGMDGSLSHWNLSSSTPTKPAVHLSHAHDQVIWALDYHPTGYVLASASKDYSTRFWARARPMGGQETDRWHVGDEASLAAGAPQYQQRADDDDDDQDVPLPGLTVPANMQQNRNASNQPDFALPGLSGNPLPPPPPSSVPMPQPTLLFSRPPPDYTYGGGNDNRNNNNSFNPPYMARDGSTGSGGFGGGGGGGRGGGGDDFYDSHDSRGIRRGGPLPSQEQMLQSMGYEGDRNRRGGRRR